MFAIMQRWARYKAVRRERRGHASEELRDEDDRIPRD
jgi:hypothetical protein